LGAGAVGCLDRGETGVLVGMVKGQVATTPYDVVVANKKQLDMSLVELAHSLEH
jgi:6-phosphofructokinase 1